MGKESGCTHCCLPTDPTGGRGEETGEDGGNNRWNWSSGTRGSRCSRANPTRSGKGPRKRLQRQGYTAHSRRWKKDSSLSRDEEWVFQGQSGCKDGCEWEVVHQPFCPEKSCGYSMQQWPGCCNGSSSSVKTRQGRRSKSCARHTTCGGSTAPVEKIWHLTQRVDMQQPKPPKPSCCKEAFLNMKNSRRIRTGTKVKYFFPPKTEKEKTPAMTTKSKLSEWKPRSWEDGHWEKQFCGS